ncbi:MAG: T9SS type A sorting domain-containing protein [Salinivirgaceae bacterium]
MLFVFTLMLPLKRILLFSIAIICFLSQPVLAQLFWETQSANAGKPMTGIALAGSDNLFVSYTRGILKSTDMGKTFEPVFETQAVYTIFASDNGNIYAGGSGKIFHSSDFGQSWDSVSLGSLISVTQIIENQQGILFAISGTLDFELGYIGQGVLVSENQGTTWEQRNTGLGIYTCGERIAIDKNGRLYYAAADEYVTGNGGLFISDNNGLNWKHIAIKVDGKNLFYPDIKVGNTRGLSVSPNDSLYFSFAGTSDNVAVQLNISKHISEVTSLDFWNVYSVFKNISWWLDRMLYNICFTQQGMWFSSVKGTYNSGASYITETGSSDWTFQSEGLAVNLLGLRDQQFFAEHPNGSVFMVHWLDERIYVHQGPENPVNVPEPIKSRQIQIYPNPVRVGQKFTVELGFENPNATLKIYNVIGNLVTSEKLETPLVQLQAPENKGVYFVILEQDHAKKSFRLLVE